MADLATDAELDQLWHDMKPDQRKALLCRLQQTSTATTRALKRRGLVHRFGAGLTKLGEAMLARREAVRL